jgi:hypothetical protein
MFGQGREITTMLDVTRRLAAAVLVAMVVLGGCAGVPMIHADKHLLDSVEDTKATREALFLKLGEPSGSYEGGRILTYRIGEDADRGYFLLDRYDPYFSRGK